jgi:hypothetical protein
MSRMPQDPTSVAPHERQKVLATGTTARPGTSSWQHGTVLLDAETLLCDFSRAADRAEVVGWPCQLHSELLPAPHRQKGLWPGYGAIYAFALGAGTGAPAGAGAVLKVGKAGPNSDARFRSQHYTLSAGSTLAKSLLAYPLLWPWLGVESLSAATVKDWMLANLDRWHVYVPGDAPAVLSALEVYARARMGSVFEGSA